MFLRILDPEDPGSRIGFDVFFQSEGGEREVLTGEGEVAWSRQEFEGPDLPPGMGIRFLSLAPGGAEILSRRLAGDQTPASVEVSEESRETGSRAAVPSDAAIGVAPEDEPHESPSAGTIGHWRFPLVLLLLALLLGVWWSLRGSGEEAVTRTARSLPETPTVVSPEPEIVPVQADSEAIASLADEPSGGEAQPGPVEPREVSAVEAPVPPMGRILDVRVEAGSGITLVTLVGDGAFDRNRIEESYIGGEEPRIVLAVRGVERSADRIQLTATEGWVRSVRTGYHPGNGEPVGRLHVVLDVPDPGVRVQGYQPSGRELLVYVGPQSDDEG